MLNIKNKQVNIIIHIITKIGRHQDYLKIYNTRIKQNYRLKQKMEDI